LFIFLVAQNINAQVFINTRAKLMRAGYVKQKGIGTLVIIGIIFIVSVIAIAGVVSYLKGKQNLVTKDVSEMMLTSGDLSGIFSDTEENRAIGPSEAAEKMEPHSVTMWRNWDFEEHLLRMWTEKDKIWLTACDVFKFSRIEGAEKFYQYRWEYESEGSKTLEVYPMSEPIGSESFLISGELNLPALDIYEDIAAIWFRKNNIVVNITCEGSIAKVKEYARIVESRIP